MGYLPISIARVTPKWFNDAICKDLAPTYDLFLVNALLNIRHGNYKKLKLYGGKLQWGLFRDLVIL